MTVLAVNNELLCEIFSSTRSLLYPCSDKEAIERQIQAAKDLQDYIDSLSGGHDAGWFRIVKTAKEAREVIESGKLAVVLGVEVSNFLDCSRGRCTEKDVDKVDERLERLHQLGVRQVFMVHEFDNDFGGAPLFNAPIVLANYLKTGKYFDVEDCSADTFGYKYDPISLSDSVAPRLVTGTGELLRWNPFRVVQAGILGTHYEFPDIGSGLRGLGAMVPYPFYSGEAHCNKRGLTDLGKHLLYRLMDKRMIVDIDHTSTKMANDMLEI